MPWIAAALMFVLAVPCQFDWQDWQVARRGVLAIGAGLLCLFPGSLPSRVPKRIWPLAALALWFVSISGKAANPYLAFEWIAHLLALLVLLVAGSRLTYRQVLRGATPVGLVVGGCPLTLMDVAIDAGILAAGELLPDRKGPPRSWRGACDSQEPGVLCAPGW